MRRLRKAPLPATTNGTCYGDLLETEADGGDWDEAALLVLRIDPVREPLRARRVWEDHLTRAKWLVEHGYGHLFRARAAN